jgi:exopolyphosphatase/guanosine-5'-triphosphate,3'-diphosphate pyrophosphatase
LKIAVIDLGTNTFKLLVAEINRRGQLIPLFKDKIPVKLGEGGINNNEISHTPFLRGLNAMKFHKQNIDKFNVDKIYAFATSAIRSAKNGKDLVKKIEAETGIDVKIISGKKEAELIYYGVRQAHPMGKKRHLIMDIGGGSTEFVIANDKKIFWKHSFDLGAARLLERINPSEPITADEIKALNHYLKKELKLLFDALDDYHVDTLVGSSGSFDSLAEMIYHRFHTPENPLVKTDYMFNLDYFEQMYHQIVTSNYDERLKIKGLAPMRVEMIVVAVIFIKFIITRLKMEEMVLSSYSLKEGILFKIMQDLEKDKPAPKPTTKLKAKQPNQEFNTEHYG